MPIQILLVEDHRPMRECVRKQLQARRGWHVCGEAEDGCQAVQLAAKLKPDVIVMDLLMPVMDGLSAARKILGSSPEILILLHTILYSRQLKDEAEKIGIRAVIDKARTAGELCDAIEKLVQSSDESHQRSSSADTFAD